jgi:fatty-acyl-CoA synthase
VRWGDFGEETACALCYTSGTTGNPKGVLYSHRSTVLHMLLTLQPDVFGLSINDVAMPIVPMYHANAWGMPLSTAAVGCKLVLPGAQLDGASLHALIESEGVTFSAAVPTVWQGLLHHLDTTGGRLTSLRRVIIGGAALPESLVRRLREHGVETVQGWGMTETSPIGTHGKLTPEVAALPFEEQLPIRLRQGRPPFGIELKIVDDAGARLPHDGVTPGRLHVRGPTVASGYLGGAAGEILDDEGFFDTGDIATIDAQGYMAIVDRAKDVIKSGGEWISSIEIENIAAGHPKVALCAVIGIPHPRWDERPMLVAALHPGEEATAEELLATLEGRIARWWMPDTVAFIDAMPLGATGKIDKKALRARFAAMTDSKRTANHGA